MTSIFEVSPTKGILQTEGRAQQTNQKMNKDVASSSDKGR